METGPRHVRHHPRNETKRNIRNIQTNAASSRNPEGIRKNEEKVRCGIPPLHPRLNPKGNGHPTTKAQDQDNRQRHSIMAGATHAKLATAVIEQPSRL